MEDCRSATNRSFHICSESLKPSISEVFSVIVSHLHPRPSNRDRLEMWENWWHGKALRYCCESSNAPRPAR